MNGLDAAVDQFAKEACPGGTVTQYDYDSTQLFVSDDGCGTIDGSFKVTDAKRNTVCYLGGFTGYVHCLGKSFDSTAQHPKVTYRR